MARVFVSHASEDAALAAEVHRWLVDDGHEAFLDQDLSDGLVAGEEWDRRLHERLRWADAVVCLLTSAYVASVWCNAELAIARSRGSRLLPVQAEPEVRHPLLSSVQYVGSMAGGAESVRARVAEALRRVDVAGGRGWPDGRSPFPGLRPLDTDEHSVFFGRTREIDQLATRLRSPAERADPAVLLVVGPSGCGKSSLVRAGLLPVMAAEEQWWTLPAILPGTQPVAALARELAASARKVGLAWTVTDVRHRLDAGDLGGLLDDLLLAAPGHRRRHLLIVVDQFEELLTQAGPEGRSRIAELLHNGLTGRLQVVATLRPEFLDPLLSNPELSGLPTRTHILRPLRPEALRAVIEGPADRAGIGVDAELVSRLVADTGGGEALPLLAYTLAQLTDGVTRGDRISAAQYEQLGGVHGALAGEADAALATAAAAGGRGSDQIIQELLRLVTVDEQGRPTRWRIRRDELTEQVLTELQPFVDRHLLTTDNDNGHVVLGVAHEAFLSSWPPLEKRITASAAALRARRQVEQAAAEWTEHGQAPARLWERGRLAAALADTGAHLHRSGHDVATGLTTESEHRWTHRYRTVVADRVELSVQARNFLGASIRRDRRRRGRAVSILSALLVLALGLAAIAFDRQGAARDQQRVAEDRLRLATGRQLVAQAETLLDREPRTALRLNEAAVHIHDSPETRSALVNNVLTTPYAGTLAGHDGPVRAVAFAPSGTLLASVGDDGTVRLWNISDPAAPTLASGPLTGHNGPVTEVAVAPDGSLLASAGDDGTVRLWNIRNPAAPALLGVPLTGHDGPVRAVGFAPDGSVLATAGRDGTVQLWNLDRPAAPTLIDTPRAAHDGTVWAVAFAPNGSRLASSGGDGTVRLWDLAKGIAPIAVGVPLAGDDGAVRAVAYAPDGSVLASAGNDGTVRLWNLVDPTARASSSEALIGHDGPVRGLAFASDGSLLASAGSDGTVRLWNLDGPAARMPFSPPLTGHDGPVNAVAFAPNKRLLASAGDDGTVRLWNLDGPTGPVPVGAPLTGHLGPVTEVAFASHGSLLASSGDDGTVRLWHVDEQGAGARPGARLVGHLGPVRPAGGTSPRRAPAPARGPCPSATPARSERWHSPPASRCWPLPASTAPCGCGTSPVRPVPGPRGCRSPVTTARSEQWRSPPTSPCWPRPGMTAPCGCGTSMPRAVPRRSACRSPATTAGCGRSTSPLTGLSWPPRASTAPSGCGTWPTRPRPLRSVPRSPATAARSGR